MSMSEKVVARYRAQRGARQGIMLLEDIENLPDLELREVQDKV